MQSSQNIQVTASTFTSVNRIPLAFGGVDLAQASGSNWGFKEMDMVCKQLSSADANGVQTCLTWGQADLYLPPMSYAEATQIGGAFWLCLAVVWAIKVIRVQNFEK